MTNAKILQTMKILTDDTGQSLRGKHLPVQIVYAMRRSMPAIEEAYKAYSDVLREICDRYGVSPSHPDTEDDRQEQLTQELTDLLNQDVAVDIHTIPAEAFDYDSDRYDPLSYDEIDRLWWLVED